MYNVVTDDEKSSRIASQFKINVGVTMQIIQVYIYSILEYRPLLLPPLPPFLSISGLEGFGQRWGSGFGEKTRIRSSESRTKGDFLNSMEWVF